MYAMSTLTKLTHAIRNISVNSLTALTPQKSKLRLRSYHYIHTDHINHYKTHPRSVIYQSSASYYSNRPSPTNKLSVELGQNISTSKKEPNSNLNSNTNTTSQNQNQTDTPTPPPLSTDNVNTSNFNTNTSNHASSSSGSTVTNQHNIHNSNAITNRSSISHPTDNANTSNDNINSTSNTGSKQIIPTTSEIQYPYRRSEYATAWSDARYPEYQQFIDLSSTTTPKRTYYHNRITNEVSWAPPNDPNFSPFGRNLREVNVRKRKDDESELKDEEYLRAFWAQKMLPIENAGLMRRSAACVVDLGVSGGVGAVFGGLVYLDSWNVLTAAPSIGFSAWIAFLVRDIVCDGGTRSIGKKLLGLEIIKTEPLISFKKLNPFNKKDEVSASDDVDKVEDTEAEMRSKLKLPSRYNNIFRQVYLPLYATSALMFPFILILPLTDLAFVLFVGKDGKRIGDWIASTKVVRVKDEEERKIRVKRKIAADKTEELME